MYIAQLREWIPACPARIRTLGFGRPVSWALCGVGGKIPGPSLFRFSRCTQDLGTILFPKEVPPMVDFRSIFAWLGFAALTGPLQAQVAYDGSPLGAQLPPLLDSLTIPAPDVAGLMAEDELRGHIPLRFGQGIAVQAGLRSAGQWDSAADGSSVWRLAFDSPGAKSLGVEFSSYDLPDGAKLFAYDPAFEVVRGAFTAQNENPDGVFSILPIPGEGLVLELQVPSGATDLPELEIEQVVHDYRDVFELMALAEAGASTIGLGVGGPEGGCTVNANCSVGNPYGDLKRATVRTIWSGFLCSASLLNNTAQNGTRYLYTAHHCGTGSSVLVTFNYQTPGCANGGASTSQSISGATLLATHAPSDGRLLRINNAIPTSFAPYYKGWSRSTQNLSQGVSMHHPSGGPKSVSLDTNGGGQNSHLFQGGQVIQTWDMNFQTGGTLGGSSGGPLQDQNGRVRGTLSGGPASCSISYYGRFHSFWNATNISQFLDPTGSGVTNLDGFDPNSGPSGGCEVLAYGTGLGGANVGSLSSNSVPALGNTLVFNYSGFPGGLSGIVILSAGQSSSPILGGTVLVNLQSQVFQLPAQTNGSGAGSSALSIPPTAPWVGITGYGQVGLMNPSASAGWNFSNGLSFTFCNG